MTEIGALPEVWEVVRLENVSIFIRDGTHTPPKRVIEGIPLLSARNIANGRIVRFEDDTYITENEYQKIHSNYEIQKGDVLLTTVGTIGNTVIVNTDYKFTLQRSVAIIRPDGNKLNSLFLHFVFQSNNLKRQLLGYSKTTTQAGIYLKELNGLKLTLPPLPEQRRIAEVLGTVDSAIQGVAGAIEKTERLKRGLMQRLLTRGIGHERFKETEVGRIPEEWEVVRLGEILDLMSGQYFKFSEFSNEGIRCLKIDNVGFGKVTWDTITYLPENYLKEYSDLVLTEGDIVIALNRPIIDGKVKVGMLTRSDLPSILYQRVGRMVFKDVSNLDKSYLFNFLTDNHFKEQLIRSLIGTDQRYIRTPIFLKIKIPLPPLPE